MDPLTAASQNTNAQNISLFSDSNTSVTESSGEFDSAFNEESLNLTRKDIRTRLSNSAFRAIRLIDKVNHNENITALAPELSAIEDYTLELRQVTGENTLINIFDNSEISNSVQNLNDVGKRYAASAYTLTDMLSEVNAFDEDNSILATTIVRDLDLALDDLEGKVFHSNALPDEFGNVLGGSSHFPKNTPETLSFHLEQQLQSTLINNISSFGQSPDSVEHDLFGASGTNTDASLEIQAGLESLLPPLGVSPGDPFGLQGSGVKSHFLSNPNGIPFADQAQTGELSSEALNLQLGTNLGF